MELIFVHSSSFDAKFRYPQHHPPLIRAYIVPSIMALIFFSFDTLFYSMPDFQQNQIDINADGLPFAMSRLIDSLWPPLS